MPIVIKSVGEFRAEEFTGSNIHDILSFIDGWNDKSVEIRKDTKSDPHRIVIVSENWKIHEGDYVIWSHVLRGFFVASKDEIDSLFKLCN